jgi:hypothetical protein
MSKALARNMTEDCSTAIEHLDRTVDCLYWIRGLARSVDPAMRREAEKLIADAHTLKVGISAMRSEVEEVRRG